MLNWKKSEMYIQLVAQARVWQVVSVEHAGQKIFNAYFTFAEEKAQGTKDLITLLC